MQQSQQSGSGYNQNQPSSRSPSQPKIGKNEELLGLKTPKNNSILDHEGTFTENSKDIRERPKFLYTNNNLASEIDDNTNEKSIMDMTGGQQMFNVTQTDMNKTYTDKNNTPTPIKNRGGGQGSTNLNNRQ